MMADAKIEKVNLKIEKVECEIEKVQGHIEAVEKKLETAHSSDDASYLRDEKKMLRDEKKMLLDRVNKLQDEKDKLLDRENKLLDRENKLLDRENKLQDEKSELRKDKRLQEEENQPDLVAGNVDHAKRATEAIEILKKRSGEYIQKHGKSKRPALFQEPLWHCVPDFPTSRCRSFDHRFTMVSSTGVMVMGRYALGALRQKVYDMIIGKLVVIEGDYPLNTNVMLVHGPMGSGKSHIVFLLIWDLAEEFASRPLSRRVRIIPIIDCEIVVGDSVEELLGAFIWAFADDEKSIRKLGAISDFSQLQKFLRNTGDTLVYVLDQWQVLEKNPRAKMRLNSIISSAHFTFQVRVTSAGGEELKSEVFTSHPRAYLYSLSGGINEDEVASFNLLHGTGCETKAVQALVDEQLERNPFMLALWRRHWLRSRSRPDQLADESFLIQFEKKIEGGAACVLGVGQGTALPREPKSEDLPEEEGRNVLRMGGGDGVMKEKEQQRDVTEAEVEDWKAWGSFINSSGVKAITTSIRRMLDNLNSNIKLKADMITVLWDIVFRSIGFIDSNHNILSKIDLRYFVYNAERGCLSCAFPLVRAELARFLDEIKKCEDFHHDCAWEALELAVDNGEPPSVVGLLAERCCNAAIAVGGGHTVVLGSANTRPPTVTYFRTGTENDVAKKAVKMFMKSKKDEGCFIFLPQSSFYDAVDNIVVRLYREKEAGKKKALEGDICMDLAKTQVTLQSMEKHSASTISAMAPEAISPWISEVNGKVQVTMAYVVPGQTIHKGTEKETVPGCSPKPIGGERGAQRRQVEHTLRRIPFGKVHDNLKILDKWSSQKRLV